MVEAETRTPEMFSTYFAEGAVRATSDQGLSVWLASLELLLSTLIFVACALQVRLRLAAARAGPN